MLGIVRERNVFEKWFYKFNSIQALTTFSLFPKQKKHRNDRLEWPNKMQHFYKMLHFAVKTVMKCAT